MAHIVNPHNYDTEDDAVFAGLLMQGLVWIEDDEDEQDRFVGDVLDEAYSFLEEHDDEWVNFSRLNHHLYETFGKIDPKKLGKQYKNLVKFFEDYSSAFELRLDEKKNGLYFKKLIPRPPRLLVY